MHHRSHEASEERGCSSQTLVPVVESVVINDRSYSSNAKGRSKAGCKAVNCDRSLWSNVTARVHGMWPADDDRLQGADLNSISSSAGSSQTIISALEGFTRRVSVPDVLASSEPGSQPTDKCTYIACAAPPDQLPPSTPSRLPGSAEVRMPPFGASSGERFPEPKVVGPGPGQVGVLGMPPISCA